MSERLVECVPNFSEGRDRAAIDAIVAAIRSVGGVEVLDVDPGAATNRTVVTFVAPPEAALAGAFAGIAEAARRIDMRVHRGEHPRQGATDVCPFVPLAGVSEAECVELARKLGKRVGEELAIPVFLYGAAATRPERVALADIRKGEYEALEDKLRRPEWAPDFGRAEFNPRSGATVIGVRPFLIAYNVNLNSRNTKLAKEIGLEIRETGRNVRDAQGRFVRDAEGNPVLGPTPHTLPHCRATGWLIEEYGCAQVTMNLTNFHVTPIHTAFDTVCRLAEQRGARVTGSEIVGLVPREALLMAGRHYLARQGAFTGVSDDELIRVAVRSLGLAEVAPFDPREKIIEERVSKGTGKLVGLTLRGWSEELASDSMAPGGGSVAAFAGSMAAGLSAMVAALTHGKKGYGPVEPEMAQIGQQAHRLKDRLLAAVDRDTAAFNAIIAANRMAKATDEEQAARQAALEQANRQATLVPLEVLEGSREALELAQAVVKRGNANSLSDAGVAGLMGQSGAWGAFYNVLINLANVTDPAWRAETLARARQAIARAAELDAAIREEVLGRLEGGLEALPRGDRQAAE